ncbi:MAG: hydantoinase/oxoprolinase family protein [Blastocatellales bacterium]
MKVRIGIDVGGTFTDVVLVDQGTREIIGQLKMPTTHSAREGVALGIVTALERAMTQFGLKPEDVSFIAHSTTQATNALLEGDVAPVGILGMGAGIEGWLARRATRVPPIALTAAKSLDALHGFISAGKDGEGIDRAIENLASRGAEVIVASEAFGVDQNRSENLAAECARRRGLLATTGHEVSSLYGLRVRTRTAVINAAILPKMIETATMTESCVKSAGIGAPLMIMRSDGGVMSVQEVHRRPILTMLSGPAAGIAGALMHERVSDGIFIEVGGTSADISVIRDGSPATRPARLNGHRMYLNTLDVRTLGVGGGSMIRLDQGGSNDRVVIDVGPRSAHIAGLGYACFAEPADLAGATLEMISPTSSDPADHAVLATSSGKRFAVTTTCAANLLGLAGPDSFAHGSIESARLAFELIGRRFGDRGPEEIAREVLTVGCRKLESTIDELIAEYQLPRDQVVLVGGGGGAAVLVPFTGSLMGLDHRIARNAEVISPIGVAMAMVRDTVERNIVDPSPDDILRIRREATEAAVAAGAVAETVEVQVEVDKRRNLVRATAMGTTELRRRDEETSDALSTEACLAVAARSMRVSESMVRLEAENGAFRVFSAEEMKRTLFGLLRQRRQMLRVIDQSGVVRLQRGAALVIETTVGEIDPALERAVDALTDFGDAGRAIPDLFLIYGSRIANFTGLAELAQVQALARVELRSLDPDVKLILIGCKK